MRKFRAPWQQKKALLEFLVSPYLFDFTQNWVIHRKIMKFPFRQNWKDSFTEHFSVITFQSTFQHCGQRTWRWMLSRKNRWIMKQFIIFMANVSRKKLGFPILKTCTWVLVVIDHFIFFPQFFDFCVIISSHRQSSFVICHFDFLRRKVAWMKFKIVPVMKYSLA